MQSLFTSLQFLAWLLLRPSAWHHYVKEIDLQLAPDFALASLSPHHWQQPQIHRLLFFLSVLYPFFSGIVISAGLGIASLSGISVNYPVLGISYGAALTLFGGMMGAIIINVPVAILASMIGGIVLGINVGISGHFVDMLTICAGIFVLGMAGSLNHVSSQQIQSYPFLQQILGVFIGGIITLFILFLINHVATLIAKQILSFFLPLVPNAIFVFDLAYTTFIVMFLSIFLILTLIQYRTWQLSLFLGFSFSGLAALLIVTILQIGIQNPVIIGIAKGAVIGIWASLLFGFPYLLVKYFTTPWLGVVTGTLVSGSVYFFLDKFTQNDSLWVSTVSYVFDPTTDFSIFLDNQFLLIVFAALLGLTWHWWQPLLMYPLVHLWNTLLYRAEQRRGQAKQSLFDKHSVNWDERQYLPLVDLENYLMTLFDRYPEEGKVAIAYVSGTKQRWAAQIAQTELDILWLQNCDNLEKISLVHHHLVTEEGIGQTHYLLRNLREVSHNVAAALEQSSPYHQQLILKQTKQQLQHLLTELVRSSGQDAERFRPILKSWQSQISNHIKALLDKCKENIHNPYVIGLPLNPQQEMFVGRTDISEQLEQLLYKPTCPPLLLYGQRRMGKTSLLNNLTRLLPTTIVPLFADLQGAVACTTDTTNSTEDFFHDLTRQMMKFARQCGYTLPILSSNTSTSNPLIKFTYWLDELEISLEDKIFLLMLDEFESLNHAFAKKRLNENQILGFFRHLIQHTPRLKVLLSGSHTLDELKQWSSYLINVQTLHLTYLKEQEARQLIEHPIQNFGLIYTSEASQRVLDLTHCHPCLVQLICSKIVALKNKQPTNKRWMAEIKDVESAIPLALEVGEFFFTNIEKEISANDLAVLRFLANQGEEAVVSQEKLAAHFPEQLDLSLKNLLQRELIEIGEAGYRVQVELIRRWFAN